MTYAASPADRDAALRRLRAAGCVFAERELAVLVGAAADGQRLAALVARRAAGEPLEHVVGYADFAGIRVRLAPGVFVPRHRSELLVRLAVEHLPGRAATVVDLCCGSGALGAAIVARAPGVELHAADVEPAAVACARTNLAGPVHQGDLFAALPTALRGRIDVLVANVPYVPTDRLALLPAEARLHEPGSALDGGPDGLAVLRRVAADAVGWLSPGGVLLSEIAADQPATAALTAAGLVAGRVCDDDLDATVVVGRRPL